MLELNVEFEWTVIIMAPTQHVPKHGLFCAFYFILF